MPKWLRRTPKPPKSVLPKFPPELRAQRVRDLAIGETGFCSYSSALQIREDNSMWVDYDAEVEPRNRYANMKVTRVTGGVEVVLPADASRKKPSACAYEYYHVLGMRRFCGSAVGREKACSDR